MNYPDDFVDYTKPLPVENLNETALKDIDTLTANSYEIHIGITPDFADDIAAMSLEPAIKEYCPKDCADRFKDREATKLWLSKKRAAFLLLKKADTGELSLAGYGWSGASSSRYVPQGKTTFAIRIGQAGQGQGLATPFARLIVFGSAVLFGAGDFWLETWQSNAGAVHVYHKIGFEDVDQQTDQRITSAGGRVPDVRLYMSLPNEALPKTS